MIRRGVLALGVALVLADASVVTLALPQLLVQLHTGVVGVAAVLFVYLVGLALAAIAAVRVVARLGATRCACWGFSVVAGAGVICALADGLPLLLAGRALAALGAGAAAVGAFAPLHAGRRGREVWLLASVLGSAAGPALGGALTQALSWRAIFWVQVPLSAAAALAASGSALRAATAAAGRPGEATDTGERVLPPGRESVLAAVGLGLVSAALGAVLFLLVLLIVAGWDVSPLRAAVAVSVLPLAALLGTRVGGPPGVRAAAGCALAAGGILSLAWIPQAHLAWTVVPQLLTGAGTGMALPALAGALLPQRTGAHAARLLSLRHGAMALLLIALAPVVSDRLGGSIHRAELQGIALVLDARLPPQEKFRLAPRLFAAVHTERARANLRSALAAHRGEFSGQQLTAYDQLAERSERVLLDAIAGGFRDAFLVCGALAATAALLLSRVGRASRSRSRPGARRRALAVGLAAIALPVLVYAEADRSPPPVRIVDPCAGGPLPHSGGITGFLQDRAVELLDTVACRLHTTREELVLALASREEGRRFADTHGGIDPHDLVGPAESLLGL